MTVYGDGKQTRSFQYVADLVSNAVLLLCVDMSCVNMLISYKSSLLLLRTTISLGNTLLQFTFILVHLDGMKCFIQ